MRTLKESSFGHFICTGLQLSICKAISWFFDACRSLYIIGAQSVLTRNIARDDSTEHLSFSHLPRTFHTKKGGLQRMEKSLKNLNRIAPNQFFAKNVNDSDVPNVSLFLPCLRHPKARSLAPTEDRNPHCSRWPEWIHVETATSSTSTKKTNKTGCVWMCK